MERLGRIPRAQQQHLRARVHSAPPVQCLLQESRLKTRDDPLIAACLVQAGKERSDGAGQRQVEKWPTMHDSLDIDFEGRS